MIDAIIYILSGISCVGAGMIGLDHADTMSGLRKAWVAAISILTIAVGLALVTMVFSEPPINGPSFTTLFYKIF